MQRRVAGWIQGMTEDAVVTSQSEDDRVEDDDNDDDGPTLSPDNTDNNDTGDDQATSEHHGNAERSTVGRTTTTTMPGRRKKKRYWRDRLTETVDYALGIHHQEGKYYHDWSDRVAEEDAEERDGGDDPLSVALGRNAMQRRRRNGSGRNIGTPFWEEEGSLLSILFDDGEFGSSSNKKKYGQDILTMLNRSREEAGVNVMTSIFKSVFKTSLIVTRSVCTWASVRGTLPRPLVVFLVGTAALSARRGSRLLTVGLTLVVLRTAAEALHGYVRGDDDLDEYDAEVDGVDSEEEEDGWEGDDR